MARAMTALVAAIALAGCYDSSAEFVGDAHSDTGSDTTADTVADMPADTSMDTAHDTRHDTPVDVFPDVTPTCPAPDPLPGGPVVSFAIDEMTTPGGSNLDLNCNVESVVSEDEGSNIITLLCPSSAGIVERHRIEITTWPSTWLPIWEGMEVRFQYMVELVWWVNRWFTLSFPGSEWTILGGFDGDYPNPPIYGTFFPPLWLGTAPADCPLAPGDCFDTRRQAIRFTYNEVVYDVYDSTTTWIGPFGNYEVIVDAAEEHVNFRCTDVPGTWYTGLVLQSGWD